ncbi:hypothetical protein CLV39_1592 [Hydrogenothermus marinus]|uniref:Uncharacterized protein n=1 Tax=Hydrogenothermus marinus TaxID=133270 RepID=A0A3M0B7W7_9AQUI|nr:hypothetical protein CLV39_1592 [Hydrogenothermus marinus]
MKRRFIVAVNLMLKVYKPFEEKYGKEFVFKIVGLIK